MKTIVLFLSCLALASLACLQTAEPFVTYPADTPTPISDSTTVPAAAVASPTSANAKRLCALVIADEALHLRAKRTERSRALDYLMNGEQVTVIDPAGRWWKIQTHNGKVGYANAKYLQEGECR